LKERFPGASVHAYTATATKRVQLDIAGQLGISDPEYLIGSFDRPNLFYRLVRRSDRLQQILEVVKRHDRDSGIVYCIRRADVEELASSLNALGIRALPYHAGLSDIERQQNQEAFIQERTDVIVATVAFGMGIDKSNVRYVVHAGMPKSLESYQQESGRAGRDGLEAECIMLYSSSDLALWKKMLAELPESALGSAMASLSALDAFCTGTTCRHAKLLEYFDEQLPGDNCGACDICTGEYEKVDDALIVGQKILSCIVRTGERFGADHNAKILTGSKDRRIRELRHDELSTHGLLRPHRPPIVKAWIDQLSGQGFLAKTGEMNILTLTEKGEQLLRGDIAPDLFLPKDVSNERKGAIVRTDDWSDVNRDLFEVLRSLRREIAEREGIPAYIVFGDSSLREMAKHTPTTPDEFQKIKGVGKQKLSTYGSQFTAAIADYLEGRQVNSIDS